MFKYTKSTINETFDFVKRLIYFFQICIQLVYILYVVYRLIDSSGNLIGNISLLSIAAAYFMFQIITTREFYTKKQIKRRKLIRRVFKTSKYLVNIYIVSLSVIVLLANDTQTDNATMLLTILMILGIMFSFLFDVILTLIDRQIALIRSAFLYDMEMFKAQHGLATIAIKRVGLDLDKEFPVLTNKRTIERVKKVNFRQEQKKLRRDVFHSKTKKKNDK